MAEITSFSNPRFKELKSLEKSRNRKRGGLFLAEGRPELDIAFGRGLKPTLVVYCEAYLAKAEVEALAGPSCEVLSLSKALFDDLAYQHVPGNFMAVFQAWDCTLDGLLGAGDVVVVEALEKPGNLGAILRSCDAAGIGDVIVCNSDIDLFNPNVLRNSRGAAFTVGVAFCTNEEALTYLRQHKLPIHAAALNDNARDYRTLVNTSRKVVVFGAESKGLTAFWLDNADSHIIIPMRGTVDSLNLSVSVAVVLFGLTSPSSSRN